MKILANKKKDYKSIKYILNVIRKKTWCYLKMEINNKKVS